MLLFHLHYSKHPCLHVSLGFYGTMIKFTYVSFLGALPESISPLKVLGTFCTTQKNKRPQIYIKLTRFKHNDGM